MVTFTEVEVVETLMFYYKDFNYVNYILNSQFDSGFLLYKKCIKRINDLTTEKFKDNCRQLWLVEIQGGLTQDFNSYYESQLKNVETRNMNTKEKESEEKRIISRIKEADNKKMKEVAI